MATEVAKKEATALAVAQFEDLGGLGFEETSSEDMAIPFLRILAQLSPQVNKRDGAYVEGAEAGMIFNTVANKAYDGEKGIAVVPCYYNRRYVEWAPRKRAVGIMVLTSLTMLSLTLPLKMSAVKISCLTAIS